LEPKSALVLVDLQRGVVGLPTAHPGQDVVANAVRLAEAFRAEGLPVVQVRIDFAPDGGDVLHTRTDQPGPSGLPADWAEPVPELAGHPTDLVVTKHQWGAFHGTDLDLQLRRRGVTGIVLGGISTSIGVESTARAAHEHGYHVVTVSDAMTDLHLDAHQNSLRRIFPRLSEVDTTEAVLAALQQRVALQSPVSRWRPAAGRS
jgi:nicotinamidase-related amidase